MISVVIPAYNAERYLAETLASVSHLAAGGGQVIVVDDGSSDGTAAVARSFTGVTVLHQPNGGASVARNHGLDHVTSEHVIFLDADDVLLPQGAEHHLAAVRQHPQAPFVFGSIEEIDGNSELLRQVPLQPELVSLDKVLHGAIPRPSQSLFNTRMVRDLGGFSTQVKLVEDFDLCARLLLHGAQAWCHGQPVVRYRRHPGQLTNRTTEMMHRVLGFLLPMMRENPQLGYSARDMEKVWHRKLGGYIPFEVLRSLQKGDIRRAAWATGHYCQALPHSLLGTAEILKARF